MNQKGRTMLEIVGVAVISAIMLLGVVRGFQGLYANRKASTTWDWILKQAMDINIRYQFAKKGEHVKLFSDRTTYDGYILTLENGGELQTENSALVYTMLIHNIPKRVCRAMVKKQMPSVASINGVSTYWRQKPETICLDSTRNTTSKTMRIKFYKNFKKL